MDHSYYQARANAIRQIWVRRHTFEHKIPGVVSLCSLYESQGMGPVQLKNVPIKVLIEMVLDNERAKTDAILAISDIVESNKGIVARDVVWFFHYQSEQMAFGFLHSKYVVGTKFPQILEFKEKK